MSLYPDIREEEWLMEREGNGCDIILEEERLMKGQRGLWLCQNISKYVLKRKRERSAIIRKKLLRKEERGFIIKR